MSERRRSRPLLFRSNQHRQECFAKGNYAAYVSPFHSDLQLLYPAALISTGQKLSRVTDGTSKTIVFSEVRTLDPIPQDERGALALPWNAASLLSPRIPPPRSEVDGNGCPPKYLPRAAVRLPIPAAEHDWPDGPMSSALPRGCAVAAQLDRMPCLKWAWDLGLGGYISASLRSNHILAA